MQELIKSQNKSRQYLEKTAQKSTPQNNVVTVSTLASAQKLLGELQDYSKDFGYDVVQDLTKLNSVSSTKNKPKNGLFQENGMTGLLNIGTSKGKPKKSQEDSILMLTHPDNKDFRIAVVADGMGGMGNGDAASFIATSLTSKWFKNLPKQFYNSDVVRLKYQNGKTLDITLQDAIKELLVDINNKIVEYLGDSPGTTFSAAITRNKGGKDVVTSVSIGDSKILRISKDGKVTQLSKDDNMLSEGMRRGSLYVENSRPNDVFSSKLQYSSSSVKYKQRKNTSQEHTLNEGDVRFHKKNNLITGYLGCGQTRK